MNKSYYMLFVFLVVVALINYSNAVATLKSYKVDDYVSYGTSVVGCPLFIGVVLDLGNEQVVSFSDNVESDDWNGPKKYYYVGGEQIFKLQINDIPFGSNYKATFNVTDTSNILSTIVLEFDKPFQCNQLKAPFNEIGYIGEFYSFFGGYGFGIDFSVSDSINLESSITCEISFAESCIILKSAQLYFVYGSSLLNSGMGLPKIYFKLYDLFGGSRTFEFDNTLFSYSSLPSTLSSYSVTPTNNSQIIISPSGELTNKIQLLATYSELNAFPLLRGPSGEITGELVLGTPTSKTYYFYFYVQDGLQEFKYWEVNSNPISKLKFRYTGSTDTQQLNPAIIPTTSIIQSQEANNNLIFSMSFKVPYISNDLLASPVLVSPLGLQNSTTPKYPYGYSKSLSNSYWEFNSDCLILPINHTLTSYSVKLDSIQFNGMVKFPNVSNLINSDNEGPILHSFKSEPLENNKLLITLNITDKGTGAFNFFGAQPSITGYALEIISAGDPNDGIYQILSDNSEFVDNIFILYVYDHFGNQNLNGQPFYYTDLNYTTASPFTKDLTVQDIHTFKFDKHQIDTSFDNLDLTLTIGFNGASKYSVVPKIAVSYTDNRVGENQYLGVFNETSGMFDIKIHVQARKSGSFQYALSIPPVVLYNSDLEPIFPSEKVLLATNYIDHFPPTITNFKSITNTNLTIQLGQQVTIGWTFDIYDYPVGLDYGIIQVVSSLDFEPRVFTVKPDPSIPSGDIKSNYTISFSVAPYVNHTYYISSIKLYDKNGYYSMYPPTQFYKNGFNTFFGDQFESEQYITVGISNSSQEQDTAAPELLSLTFPQVFDSFSTDRVAIFNFTLRDNGTGISLRHNPFIHVQLIYAFQYKSQSELVRVDNDTGIHYYGASIEFEYGKLAYGAIVSIHGIIDNVFNMASFTSRQLSDKGFPSIINNSPSPFENRPPVILDYSTLNEDGGRLFIYGKEFTDTPLVYMNKGGSEGFVLVATKFTSNLAITANIPSVKGYDSIKFKVISKSSLESNIITIKPTINPIIKESNCTSLNNCNGKGQCIESKCVCYPGYSGIDCLSTSTDVDNKPNDTPSINAFGTMISINELEELDINGNPIKTYQLLEWSKFTIQSQYQPTQQAYKYTSRLDGTTNTNVTITIDIFNQDTQISFASKTLYMDKGTIKYTIQIDSYPFSSRFNTLQLKVNASISSQDARCKLSSIGLSPNSDNIEWLKLRSDNKSIFGKFIQSAEIDYRLLDVSNKLLVSPTNENQQAVIGIQIPYYFEQALLDPDFSVIFDVDDLGKNNDATCSGGTNSGDGLSKSKIIVVSVICGVVGVAIVIASVILFLKKRSDLKFRKILKNNQLTNK